MARRGISATMDGELRVDGKEIICPLTKRPVRFAPSADANMGKAVEFLRELVQTRAALYALEGNTLLVAALDARIAHVSERVERMAASDTYGKR